MWKYARCIFIKSNMKGMRVNNKYNGNEAQLLLKYLDEVRKQLNNNGIKLKTF